MRFRLRWLLLAALLLTGLWYYRSPRRAWDRFMRGIVLAQEADLVATIDFPVLRDNLRQQLSAALQRGTAPDLMARAGSVVVDQMVAQVVTPRGLTSLVTAFGTPSDDPDGQDREPGGTVTSFHYRGPSTVEVRVRPADADDTAGGIFTFTRSGLHWRLTRIWSDRLSPLGDRQ